MRGKRGEHGIAGIRRHLWSASAALTASSGGNPRMESGAFSETKLENTPTAICQIDSPQNTQNDKRIEQILLT